MPLVLPTGGGDAFLGGGGAEGGVRLLGELAQAHFRVLANAGVVFRKTEVLHNLEVGNAFTYGVGVAVPWQLDRVKLGAEATLAGAIGLGASGPEERPLELLAAISAQPNPLLQLRLGGGPGHRPRLWHARVPPLLRRDLDPGR